MKFLATIICGFSIYLAIFNTGKVQMESLFNGTCPEYNYTYENETRENYLGIWYMFAAIPRVDEVNDECRFSHIFYDNGTVYFDVYSIDKLTNTSKKTSGVQVPGPDYITYIVYTDPVEFVIPVQLLGSSPSDYLVTYSCDECGFYGKSDGGLHPYIWTRVPEPNCTVTDPAWAVLDKHNISQNLLTLVNQNGCAYPSV